MLERARRLQKDFLDKFSTLEGTVHRRTEASVSQIPLIRQNTEEMKKELLNGRDEFKKYVERDEEWKKSQAGMESKRWMIQQCIDILQHAQCMYPTLYAVVSQTYIN